MLRIAINGFGRIGRSILRAYLERVELHPILSVVAVNDLAPVATQAHLLQYDTVHGPLPKAVQLEQQGRRPALTVDGHQWMVFSESDPTQLPWREEGIDLVLECTGAFTTRARALQHVKAGAKKVLMSAPSGDALDATVVYGVNHRLLRPDFQVVSNASCTTNCLAPLALLMHQAFGIEQGLMNTIHAYTNDQVLIDVAHPDLRRARSATHSMIPTKTGAAAAVGLVLPELNGKLDGFSIRVPTINVSAVDFSWIAERAVSEESIHQTLLEAIARPEWRDVLAVNHLPLVSVDFNHHRASAIVDLTQTKVQGRLVKLLAWYDNEWGFSNRMLDVAAYWLNAC